MSNNQIKINDVTLNAQAGTAVTFEGKHVNRALSGIDLNFTVWRPQIIDEIEELFTEESVQVEDPFVNRSYQAKLHRIQYSYQDGRPERHYVAELRELDKVPEFNLLEIEGHKYPVLKYYETDHEDDAIGRHALLQLSEAQLMRLHVQLESELLHIKRVGIDDEAVEVIPGGAVYWSKHQEDGGTYYKQIVRFFPPGFALINIASGTVQKSLAHMLQALSARFEALTDVLVQNKIVTDEKRNELLGEDWQALISPEKVDHTRWELRRTHDAEEDFD